MVVKVSTVRLGLVSKHRDCREGRGEDSRSGIVYSAKVSVIVREVRDGGNKG